jgi:hypothetical protein
LNKKETEKRRRGDTRITADAKDQPMMLHQVSIAILFGHPDHKNISNWIRALKTLGVLVPAEAAIPRQRAARYFYLAA